MSKPRIFIGYDMPPDDRMTIAVHLIDERSRILHHFGAFVTGIAASQFDKMMEAFKKWKDLSDEQE